ncbi:unnamed protein product [Acanthoscelides obtectus]|uniref:Uncharacterized protein n=1 Tax=Acanthoscelides obtectus TaxID=200917 RepID=A0A9P0KGM2_ACAOB|nr:unnamed protein product [Acanthoscelides obtectus]CAK1644689.1 hypothetical protein AOBTE_LOCUS13921 [Acanthoscelides obtectus]
MKLPFNSFLGPVLKKNQKSIQRLCGVLPFHVSHIYVGILGVLGVALSLFDIIRIVKCGPVLPGYLWRERLKTGTLVPAEVERDCKLICLVLSLEYYCFLLVGLLTNSPIFFLPFMILYAVMVVMESVIFFVRAFVGGLDYKRSGLIMSMFMTYNWLSVFCTFCRAMNRCDV